MNKEVIKELPGEVVDVPVAAEPPKPAKAKRATAPAFVSEDVIRATFKANTSANYLFFNALGHAFFTQEAAEASAAALENKKVQRIVNPLKP